MSEALPSAPQVLTADICVLGAGAGGLSVAAAAAAFGVPVVLVEKDKMGGDCLNVGCVPSKSLLAAARRAASVRTAPSLGVTAQGAAIDFAAVQGHVRRVIAAIAPNDSRERFGALGVRVVTGQARFKDAQTVTVDGRIEIKARRTVIATGSHPAIPPIPGLAETPHLTNETLFSLTACPKHLLVIGGGPIGLEMAQAYRRLGARVTVVEAATPLANDDPECAAVVLRQLQREGVIIHGATKVVRVEGSGDKLRVVIERPEGETAIEGSHILVAAGRTPNIDELDLKSAGIAVNARGVVVDKRLRTSNRKVYAIGDVAGGPMFTHVASLHAGAVIRRILFRARADLDVTRISRVTFTDPELAHVGLTEAAALERHGRKLRVLRWSFHDNDRAQAEGATAGHIKVLTAKNGRILGATIVGAKAGELIATWALAVSQGMNIRALAELVVPYPTLAEVGKRAAITFFTPKLASPWIRRLIAWTRRLG